MQGKAKLLLVHNGRMVSPDHARGACPRLPGLSRPWVMGRQRDVWERTPSRQRGVKWIKGSQRDVWGQAQGWREDVGLGTGQAGGCMGPRNRQAEGVRRMTDRWRK